MGRERGSAGYMGRDRGLASSVVIERGLAGSIGREREALKLVDFKMSQFFPNQVTDK